MYSLISVRFFLPVLIVLWLSGVHCHLVQEIFQEDVHDHLWKGSELSPDQAALLEEKLAADPYDVTSRTLLLGYYFGPSHRDSAALAAKRRHVLWLIRNSPDAAALGFPEGAIDSTHDPEGYSAGRKTWMDHLEGDPDNLTFLGHAAEYLDYRDRKTKFELLQRARSLDPSNAKWPRRLGFQHELNIFRRSQANDKQAAEKALELYEDAYELSDERDRERLLENLAGVAFEAGQHDKARKYAESLLRDAQRGGSYGNRVHHGNLILGRIALAEGNINAAKFRLIAAGNIPSEPNLSTFGPKMTLAKELLKKGEREVVLRYFRLCSRFWEMDEGRLEKWAAVVEQGKIPDFGPNLRY